MSAGDRPVPVKNSRLVHGRQSDERVARSIGDLVLGGRVPREWIVGFAVSFALFMLLLVAVTYLFAKGVGIWGIKIPVAWGFAIVNFVWWIGIGHAGTLISAILLLLHQEWRTSINRFAEAMTLFAVACAGMFPLLHLGRPWLFYYILPYFNSMKLWPQFRSPLVWDVFAVLTYATVSLIFWYVGLIPDVATLRDRARRTWVRKVYGVMALGWRNSARHWSRYQTAYLLLAALATPLVLSVHSIVGLDFTVANVPGWHSTIFPPYFVAGAIYSGFSMVLTLMIPVRLIYHLEDYVTEYHLDVMAKLMLAMGLMVTYGYVIEAFMSWYSADVFERYMQANRALGPYGPVYWVLIFCNSVAPQALWFRAVRRNMIPLFIVAVIINLGMWVERYVIVVTSLSRDFLPTSWQSYGGTGWDWATLVGSVGLFLTLLFLFIRFLPMISMHEMRELWREEAGE